MRRALLAMITCCAFRAIACAAQTQAIDLRWLEGGVPAVVPGATWGVPFPRGEYPRDAAFTLHNASGAEVPLQSWPLATWPDGSLKWSAFAIGADAGRAPSLTLGPGKPALPATAVTVTENPDSILVDTGVIQCRIARTGTSVIESISRGGQVIARDGRLVCLRRDQPDIDADGAVHQESFDGEISKVTVEQRGPVRAVVRIEGKHACKSGRRWLPFVLRLYFYAGGESVRVMHTMIFDGDANSDFISGLGLRFTVPMQGELYNRHIRFAGQDRGVWGEAVRGLTGLRRDPGSDVRAAQVAGEPVPPVSQWKSTVASHIDLIPAFGDFSLFQSSADSFEIRKRTETGYAWINSTYGKRAAGLGYVGSPQGGLAFGIRNFWQSFPSQLDIRGAAGDQAEVTLWLWSPQAPPMDMRFYHGDMGEDTYEKQLQGLDITYEDYEPGFATPVGVARTSEMMIWALPATPARDHFADLASALQTPPQLVCKPADYHAAQVFGGSIWNLPDRSTPTRARIEDQLDSYLDFYKNEVEQRHWYGFWYYGNVMHTYDEDRHVWRYDVGGFAWDNSELSTDLWLWYSFLRSGRPDIFRMAEAMTRNTGEVDVYHLGPFAGLGTRHGVVPWGDSAKQMRISTAANRRFYYYLTADERVGDLMWEEVDADRKVGNVPPTRKLVKNDFTNKPYSMVLSVGTDWGAVSAALLTAWERTGETKYRDKLVASMKSIAALKHGWFSGGGGYDPQTGRFYDNGNGVEVSHLSIVFGGFEMNAELLQLLDVPGYAKTWLQYCQLYNATPAQQAAAVGQDLGKLNLGQAHARLTAYAAWTDHDPQLAARAWQEFFGAAAGLKVQPVSITHVAGPQVLAPVNEIHVSTNAVAQWGLAAIECLGLVGDAAPQNPPL